MCVKTEYLNNHYICRIKKFIPRLNTVLVINCLFAVVIWLLPLLLEYTCAHQSLCDNVRVTVGGRTAVLKVALFVVTHRARDADAGAAVGHASRELVDV